MNPTSKIGIPGYCPIVSGKEGYIMFNLERNKYVNIPPVFYEILTQYQHLSIAEMAQLYGDMQGKITTFMDSLSIAGFVFETDTPHHYPPINTQWNRPEIIFTAAVSYHAQSPYQLADAFEQLNTLGTKYLEVRFSGKIMQPIINQFLGIAKKSRLVMLDLIIDFRSIDMPINAVKVWIENLFQQYPKLNRILLYHAPDLIPRSPEVNLYTSQKPFEDISSDSLFSSDKYYINAEFFKESLQFNPYYNRRVCIDECGRIKNCLLLSDYWGVLPEDSLLTVVQSDDFQALWHWNNDNDAVLKDSAFRYVVLNRVTH